MLKQKNQVPEVLTVCLNLLGNEVKDEAKQLLKQENQVPEVLAVCLNLLGDDAKDEARHLLGQKKHNYHTLNICLKILWGEAKVEARKLLNQKIRSKSTQGICIRILAAEGDEYFIDNYSDREWENLSVHYRCNILMAINGSRLRRKRAAVILSNWRRSNRRLVSSAFFAFEEDPHDVTKVCKEILKNWELDYNYSRRHGFKFFSGHISRSLCHPALKLDASSAAHEILIKMNNEPNLRDSKLKETALRIVNSDDVSWSKIT